MSSKFCACPIMGFWIVDSMAKILAEDRDHERVLESNVKPILLLGKFGLELC
jgi:hypothetical protein